MSWKACGGEQPASGSESSPAGKQLLGAQLNVCGAAATQGGSHFWETERENFSFRCKVIPSYLVPSLSTVQKYPGPETTGDFREKKGSGDEALIIVCVSLSLLSYQGQSQRAGVGPLDSWKVLPIKHLSEPHLLRCVQCWQHKCKQLWKQKETFRLLVHSVTESGDN